MAYKELIMPGVEVRLDGVKGETLQDFLVNQVDCNNWKKEIKYEFYRSRNNETPIKASFVISPSPKKHQPRNGFVEFLDLEDTKSFLQRIFTRRFKRCVSPT